jgi:WD40 repeat protein
LASVLETSEVVLLPQTEDLFLNVYSPGSNRPNSEFNANALWPGFTAGSVDFSKDGETAAIGLFKEEGARRSRIITAVNYKHSLTYWSNYVSGPVIWMRWSHEGKRLLANVGGLQPIEFGMDESQPKIKLSGHTARVIDAAYSADSKLIATASADQTVRVWNAETGELIWIFHGLGRPATAVAWSPNGKEIFGGDDNGGVLAFHFPSTSNADTLKGVFSDVHGDFAFNSHLNAAAVTATSNSVVIADLHSLSIRSEIKEVFQPIAFSKDGGYLFAFAADWSVKKISMSNHEPELIGPRLPEDFSVKSWGVDLENGKILMAGSNGRIAIIDWVESTIKHAVDPETNSIWAVAPSPSENSFWTGTEGGTIRRWESSGPYSAGEALKAPGDIQALAVSSDGKWLATSLFNETSIRVFNRSKSTWIRPLASHRRFVQTISFTRDGHRMISAGADGRVTIWRVPEFEEIAAFEIDAVERPTGDEGISALHLSEDGKVLGALTEDGRLRIWRTD